MLSVVIPAYNESAYLEATVREIHDGLVSRGGPFELVVVENGSLDDTHHVAQVLADRYDEVGAQSLERADYGAALRAGLLAARGDVVACFDADYYDLDFLDEALGRLAESDVVVGSKRAAGSVDTRPFPRRVVTAVFGAALRLGFGLEVSDTHGMKALRRDAVVDLVPRCIFDGDLFDTELVIRAGRAGYRVVELPVIVSERRPARTSVWSRAPRALIGLVRLRLVLRRESR